MRTIIRLFLLSLICLTSASCASAVRRPSTVRQPQPVRIKPFQFMVVNLMTDYGNDETRGTLQFSDLCRFPDGNERPCEAPILIRQAVGSMTSGTRIYNFLTDQEGNFVIRDRVSGTVYFEVLDVSKWVDLSKAREVSWVTIRGS